MRFVFCFSASFALFICIISFTSVEKTGYDLNNPKRSFTLPDTLREISGITNIDDNTIACIQDENGILFFYDIINRSIQKQYKFNTDGDYEGIARVDNSIYILQSDGVLFEIRNYTSKEYKLQRFVTGIPSGNNEGLCYDADHNRLLIASKGKINKSDKYKNLRTIYSFDLATKKLSAKPVLSFNVNEINMYAKKLNIHLPGIINQKGETIEHSLKFNTSEIAIHPFSKKLYLLSAVDHLLFVFDLNGTIEDMVSLDPRLFRKAEGITFLTNGDMLISNEAKGMRPTLLQFAYEKNK